MRGLNKSAGLALAMALAGMPTAVLGSASDVVSSSRVTGTKFIKAGDYYTQVIVDAQDVNLPVDDKGKRNLGAALLKALGLGNKTRSLTITMALNQGGQSLPEVPLISYEFDGRKTLTRIRKNASYVSPRWQLDPGSPISVTLKYYYSTTATYDVAAISGNIQKLIPSKSIASALASPFFTGIAGLTASIFQTAEARTVDVANADNLSPFAGAIGKLFRTTLNNKSPKDPIKGTRVGVGTYPSAKHHIFPTRWVHHLEGWDKTIDTANLALNIMYVEEDTNGSWLNCDPRDQILNSIRVLGSEEQSREIYLTQGITTTAYNILLKPAKTKQDFIDFIAEREAWFAGQLEHYGFKRPIMQTEEEEIDDDDDV